MRLLIQMEVDCFPRQNENKGDIIKAIKKKAGFEDFKMYKLVEE